eukprot:1085688-Rhodomonas_salina.1
MLAKQVHDGNQHATGNKKVNLVGYLVGNGVTDPIFDGNAIVPFARLHAFCCGSHTALSLCPLIVVGSDGWFATVRGKSLIDDKLYNRLEVTPCFQPHAGHSFFTFAPVCSCFWSFYVRLRMDGVCAKTHRTCIHGQERRAHAIAHVLGTDVFSRQWDPPGHVQRELLERDQGLSVRHVDAGMRPPKPQKPTTKTQSWCAEIV